MQPFTTLEAVAAPLPLPNIDTDIIIPMAPMMMLPKSGLGEVAFQPLRFAADGTPRADFPLNAAPFDRAQILVAGRNFGCGSSRERAVDAVAGMGIRCIIAPSFGDIFFGNCIKNGVLPIVLAGAEYVTCLEEARSAGGVPFRIDLPAEAITLPSGRSIAFPVDPGHKSRLIAGRDEIAITLEYETEIARFQAENRKATPWIWSPVETGRPSS